MAGRNDEQHFSGVPTIDIERSKFKRPFTHKTTFNMGKLIPFYVDSDILPGETHSFTTSIVARLLDPAVPIMDNLFLDTYYFFIPSRLCWTNFKKHMGENVNGAWAVVAETERPHIIVPTGGYDKNAVATYMGIPQGAGVEGCTFDREAITAYCMTWNEWFRDQNIVAPLELNLDDGDTMGSNDDPRLGGKVLPVYKFHDVFTSSLPQPQKGNSISMPLGTTAPIRIKQAENGAINRQFIRNVETGKNINSYNPGNEYSSGLVSKSDDTATGVLQNESSDNVFTKVALDLNGSHYVDLTQATAATVNALRLAFATQRILEKDARGGTRMREIVKNHFHTTMADARAQIPEYIGGATRVPINIEQVTQTSSGIQGSPLGQPGATSTTTNVDDDVTYSSQEWGTIIGVLCVRQDHTYQQGINRMWKKRKRLDQYWTALANLGEGPVYASELKATPNGGNDDVVFGYQEAWYWYRYLPGYVSGELSSLYAQSLDIWHLGDEYTDTPVLSDEFLRETDQYLYRSLISSDNHQFIADIYVENTAVRPMPVYSVPGLLDHF